tara:strand:- start:36 stop:197 length:162 start_codon:yes stop_codon:yes gene_type:complete
MSKDDQFKIVMVIFSLLMVGMLFWVTINIGRNSKDISEIKNRLYQPKKIVEKK